MKPPALRGIVRDLLAKAPLLDGLFRRHIWSRVHFPELELSVLDGLASRAFDVAIDVGAAKGSYTWVLSRVSRTVIAFEPGIAHSRLLRLAALGSHVKIVHAAVGRSNGLADLYTPGRDSNALHSATISILNSVTKTQCVTVESVKQFALDSFLAEYLEAEQSVDFLKIDVEGYELEVLLGALTTLNRFHPLIICEIEARHNPGYSSVFALLESLGYISYAHREGRFTEVAGVDIPHLQNDEALRTRLGLQHNPMQSTYINNFVFQHPLTRTPIVLPTHPRGEG